MKKIIIEALKEGGRVILLAIVPVLIVQIEQNQLDWRAIGVVGILALLRVLDKFMHLVGKDKKDPRLTLGLTRF